MAITDLTGYTWVGNDNLLSTIGYADGYYSLIFTSNNISYSTLNISVSEPPQRISYDSTRVWGGYSSSSWSNTAYKTIEITGGTDATNATLISWLEANGTLTAPVVTSGSMHIGTSNISNMSIGNTEILKVYLGQDLVYEKQAPSGYQVSVYSQVSGISSDIYDGQDSSGRFLGSLLPQESDTYTITSGYIYTTAIAIFQDTESFPPISGNPFPISSDISLMLSGGSND